MTDDTGTSFADQDAALRLREVVKKIASDQVGSVQPLGKIGRVVSVDNMNLKCKVWFPGDDGPMDVLLLSNLLPVQADVDSSSTVSNSTQGWGGRVWVEKVNGKSYVTAVLNGGTLASPSVSMERHIYMANPAYGQSSQGYGVQVGSTVSFVVPAPAAQNSYIGFGPFDGSPIGYTQITVRDNKFGMLKTYKFTGLATFGAAFTANTWYKLIPEHVNTCLDFFTDIGDFDLEIGNTSFVSLWDSATYYMMALRIHRKNDNQPSFTGQTDGYRIVIDSHMGINRQKERANFFPFTTWETAYTTETPDNYGGTDQLWNAGTPQAALGPYHSSQLDYPRRSQFAMTGPSGYLIWDGTNLKWSGEFRCEGVGSHTHTVRGGYFQFGMPANGYAIPVYGDTLTTSRLVTANGINLEPGEALYYRLPVGGTTTLDATRYVIVMTAKDVLIPSYWVMVAQYTGLDSAGAAACPTLKLGTGDFIDYWHRIGDAGQPAFTNSWVDYNTGTRRAGFRKENNQVVRLYGMIKNGTVGSVAFTLPVGYRPVGQLLCSTMSGSAAGRLDVLTNGQVTPIAPSVNSWVSMDSITFVAEG